MTEGCGGAGKEGEAIVVLNKVMEESEAEECINEMAAGAGGRELLLTQY